jgi:sugar lactone lactonase YvrE
MLKRVLFFLFCIACSSLYAQPQWMVFNGSGGAHGLLRQGNQLWVNSGAGITRISLTVGSWQNFKTTNSNLLSHNINDLATTPDGLLWAALGDAGLAYFDGANWSSLQTLGGITLDRADWLATGPDGALWVSGFFEEYRWMKFENGVGELIDFPEDATRFREDFAVAGDGILFSVAQMGEGMPISLVRYDGENWSVVTPESLGLPTGTRVYDIEQDSEGRVYMLFSLFSPQVSALGIYEEGTFEMIPVPAKVNDFVNEFNPISVSPNGQVFISLRNNTVLRLDGTDWATIDMAALGLDTGSPDGIVQDDDGAYWVVYRNDSNGRRQLFKLNDGQVDPVQLANTALPVNYVSQVRVGPQNNKWVQAGQADRLFKFDGKEWMATPPIPDHMGWSHELQDVDEGQNVWVSGYSTDGAIRFDGLAFGRLRVPHPQYGGFLESITGVEVDTAGDLWMQSGNWVLQYKKDGFAHSEGFYAETPYADYHMPNQAEVIKGGFGDLWAAANKVFRYHEESWEPLPNTASALNLYGRNVAGSHSGTFWLHNNLGDTLYYYQNGNWTATGMPDELLSSFSFNFSDMRVGPDTTLWLATHGGLWGLKSGQWSHFHILNTPLPSNNIQNLDFDTHGTLWIGTACGLVAYNPGGIEDIFGSPRASVAGRVFRDLNGDGLFDEGDVPLQYHRVLLLPDSVYSFTNADGTYHFNTAPGHYEVQYLPTPGWSVDAGQDSYAFEIELEQLDGFDFRVAPETEIEALNIELVGNASRCNLPAMYWLDYSNRGTLPESGQVRLVLDPDVIYQYSEPAPDYWLGDTLVWTFSDLFPEAVQGIAVITLMPGVQDVADSLLVHHASVYRMEAPPTSLEETDSQELSQILRCSYDPNDKLVASAGPMYGAQSLHRDPLEYTIRFQNTGNDTAFTVVIRDTLDKNLDWSTFEPLAASHAHQTVLRSNGALEFRFEDIYLPDSIVNEPASHGFVKYRIRAKAVPELPLMVYNRAAIYFDLNPPIITNTTVSELVENLPTALQREWVELELTVSPNPVREQLQVRWAGGAAVAKVVNSSGQTVIPLFAVRAPQFEVPVAQLPAGIYFLKLEGQSGRGAATFVKW